MKKKILKFFGFLVAGVLIVVSSIPFIYVVSQSFVDRAGFTTLGYYDVFLASPQYLNRFWSSMGLCLCIVAGQLVVSVMGGYGFAKCKFKCRQISFFALMMIMILPLQVTLVPNYIVLDKMGLLDTYWALLLPAFAAPIGLFMMKQFMEGLPTALIEAAHIDGANEFRIFWSIVMPNVKPAWLTVIIFSVQSLWNPSASTVIYSEAKKTLVYALQQIQAGGIARTGQAAAVTVVVMAVPIFIFVLSQSQILETMASSGIKD